MSLITSGFWLSFLGINIALAYSVYPLAILGRLSVAPVAYLAIGAYATTYFTTRGGSFLVGLAVGICISLLIGAILSAVAGHLRSHFFVAARRAGPLSPSGLFGRLGVLISAPYRAPWASTSPRHHGNPAARVERGSRAEGLATA